MPVTLHDFIRDTAHGDDNIAGYLEPGERVGDDPTRFLFWRSSNAMLPAFVNCLEDGGDMRRVYTNNMLSPWAKPRGPGVKRRDNLREHDGDGSLVVEPVPMDSRAWPARVVGHGRTGPLAGGLHAAARSSASGEGPAGEPVAPQLVRSLRHYAMATRTLVEASASSTFSGVHDHVGALLVSDSGEILAAGINTGSYRHAEVSLLLSWFRDNSSARTLPTQSIVMTTLTPCRQCTRYLSRVTAPDTVVLYDEADRGRSGRVGQRIAVRLDMGDDAGAGPVTASRPDTAVTRDAQRRALRNAGPDGESRMDRARQARRFIVDKADAFETQAAGAARNADAGAIADDDVVEAAVLAYLADWIRTASLAA